MSPGSQGCVSVEPCLFKRSEVKVTTSYLETEADFFQQQSVMVTDRLDVILGNTILVLQVNDRSKVKVTLSSKHFHLHEWLSNFDAKT